MWLKDDGAEFVGLPAYRMRAFDFGMAAPGAARPAVYFYVTFAKVWGLYARFDGFATVPVLPSRFPTNHIDYVSAGLTDTCDLHRSRTASCASSDPRCGG